MRSASLGTLVAAVIGLLTALMLNCVASLAHLQLARALLNLIIPLSFGLLSIFINLLLNLLVWDPA